MQKYMRLFYICFKRSLIKEMSFRGNFIIRTITDAVFLLIYFIFFSVLFTKIPEVAGWKKDELLLLIGTFHIINSLFLSIFYPNLVMVPEHIKRGTLDNFLLKPMESQILLSINNIDIGSLCNVFLGLILVSLSTVNLTIAYSLEGVLGYLFTIIVGLTILYHLFFIIILSSFWLQDASWCASFYLTLNNYMDKPAEIYTGVIGRILMYLVPLALVANIPAGILLERDIRTLILIELLVLAVASFLSRFLWKAGINKYESASS